MFLLFIYFLFASAYSYKMMYIARVLLARSLAGEDNEKLWYAFMSVMFGWIICPISIGLMLARKFYAKRR